MSTSANQNITANHLVFTDNDFSYNLKENEVNILFVNVFNTFEKFGFVWKYVWSPVCGFFVSLKLKLNTISEIDWMAVVTSHLAASLAWQNIFSERFMDIYVPA